jgi:hypothetical protein
MVGFPGESRATMEKTLALALYLRPDSAQFYPVMPFPGTTYYKWAREHGYLASERFADWLDATGGHRCVLNLPGLSAEEIDAFCAAAYRRFFFRPSYIRDKIKQAFLQPREGIRSLKAFAHFLAHLASRRRRRADPLPAPAVEVPADWYSVQAMPRGRMFEQAEQIARIANVADRDGAAPAALRDLAVHQPEI